MSSRPDAQPAATSAVDDYLAALPDDRRTELERLRRLVHEWFPGVGEKISYHMPTFVVEGHAIGGFLSHRDFLSWYPHSGSTLDALADRLEGYTRTKSALHFSVEHPLTNELFRALLDTRRAEWDA